MIRLILVLAAFVTATFGFSLAQIALPTLDWQQSPGSTMAWLTPKQGTAVRESDFFAQPGIADFLGSLDQMQLRKIRQGANGVTHRRYQQTHAGYEVEGAMFATHEKDGLLRVANGQLAMLPANVEEPGVTAEDAVYRVRARLGALGPVASEGDDYMVPQVDLLYAATTWETAGLPLEYRLAYRVGMVIPEPYISVIAYVDGQSGEVFRWEHGALECGAGNAQTFYHGWQGIDTRYYNILGNLRWELRDDCRSDLIHTRIDNHQGNPDRFYGHVICDDVKDGDNIWQATEQRASTSLHWAAEMYHDYLTAQFGRNGLSGSGDTVKLVYHPYELRRLADGQGGWPTGSPGDTTSPFGSFWDLTINEAHFGHGDGISPFVSLDLVAHELTHGLMNLEMNQMYRGSHEAKAINESFADIFSVCVEWFILPMRDPSRPPNFTFHEDVAGGATRSMAEPWIYHMPWIYQGGFWQMGQNPEPHVNSAVQTYWFYLLAFGSAGKPVEPGTSVCGIGMDKAASIAYRMITDYSAVGVYYADQRMASFHAAVDLFGSGSYEASQCVNAWAAVGIGAGASFCNPVGIQNSRSGSSVLLEVFPNPATDLFHLTLTLPVKQNDVALSLWESSGNKVANLGEYSHLASGKHYFPIDASNLASGIYHLDFSSKGSHLYKKIVIQH